jgi:protein-disulfide isomerase
VRRAVLPVLLGLLLSGCGASDPAGANGLGPVVAKVPVGDSPVSGPPDAWVTIVEFSDFQCPFCRSVQPALATVLPEFGADVRHVFKHFPIAGHTYALPSAVAAVCAHQQGRFWEFHDGLFASPASVFGSGFEGALADLALQAGLDVAAWQACRVAEAATTAVGRDSLQGRDAGVGGTPTFVVNGVLLVGSRPAADFRAAIEAARTRARASGVPAAQYYDKVILGL